MAKVTVKRIVKNATECSFKVEWEHDSKHFAFQVDAPENDIWNEEVNRKAALEFAHKIESGVAIRGEEIIYQTPETDQK